MIPWTCVFLRNAIMCCLNSCKHHGKAVLTLSGLSWCPVLTVCLQHCFPVSSCGEVGVANGASVKKIRELLKIMYLL